MVKARSNEKWAITRNLKVVICDSPCKVGMRDIPKPNDSLSTNNRASLSPPLALCLSIVGMTMAPYSLFQAYFMMQLGMLICWLLPRLIRVLLGTFQVSQGINGFQFVEGRFVLQVVCMVLVGLLV